MYHHLKFNTIFLTSFLFLPVHPARLMSNDELQAEERHFAVAVQMKLRISVAGSSVLYFSAH